MVPHRVKSMAPMELAMALGRADSGRRLVRLRLRLRLGLRLGLGLGFFWKGAGLVAEGDGAGAFAATEGDVGGVGDAEFDGAAGGADVGAVAEGLLAGAAAGAPPVDAGLKVADEGLGGNGRLFIHKGHLDGDCAAGRAGKQDGKGETRRAQRKTSWGAGEDTGVTLGPVPVRTPAALGGRQFGSRDTAGGGGATLPPVPERWDIAGRDGDAACEYLDPAYTGSRKMEGVARRDCSFGPWLGEHPCRIDISF
jgi:hypothetical protein